MKEIGGYLGLESFSGREYHTDLVGVNSGRNALLYVMKVRGYHKLYIPRFLCDSVSELCRREGFEFEEYSIDSLFLPVFDRTLGQGEALYIVNFYGKISNDMVRQMQSKWGSIIFDNVQAFFQKPVSGVDTVYSCRKFFGVPDGGYVAAHGQKLPLEPDCSRERMTHILGRYEVSGAAFYNAFQENDELFYDMPLREMSSLTHNILRGVDYDEVRRKRNENYAVLEDALGARNLMSFAAPDGPYCYPFYCKNGMELKRKLAQKKIYVPTLWPNVRVHEGTIEKDLAENILPLPCDQRYTAEDMRYIIKSIEELTKSCL